MDKIAPFLFPLFPAGLLLPCLVPAGPGGEPPRRLPPEPATVKVRAQGRRLEVLEGTLFLPDYYDLRPGPVPLLLHFQGARWLAEANFYRARVPGVLYTSGIKGLSRAFQGPYSDPGHLQAVLDDAAAKLSGLLGGKKVEFPRIGITSFSAGYGAVREILKKKEYFDKIDYILMADSIYASYLSPEIRVPPVGQMVDFARFAQEAALGRKVMVVTHSHYLPASYCGTWETADFLLACVGGGRKKVREYSKRGIPIDFRFDRAGFHLLAADEATAVIHADFFYMMGELLERFPPFRPPRSR